MRTTLFMAIVLIAARAFAQSDQPGFPPFTTDVAAVARATTACGPDDVKFDAANAETPQPAPMVEDGKALVYIIAETADALTKTAIDGFWMGANQGSSYFSFAAGPGEHHLCVKWQSVFPRGNLLPGVASFKAEAGKTYYFRVRIYLYRLDLEPIDPDAGRLLAAYYPQCVSHIKRKKSRASGSESKSQPVSQAVPAH